MGPRVADRPDAAGPRSTDRLAGVIDASDVTDRRSIAAAPARAMAAAAGRPPAIDAGKPRRAIAGSLAAHAAGIGALVWFFGDRAPPRDPDRPPRVERVDVEVVAPPAIQTAPGGGGAPIEPGDRSDPEPTPILPRVRRPAPAVAPATVRALVDVGLDGDGGSGHGTGGGDGHGAGTGEGSGGGILGAAGVGVAPEIPPPPEEARISRARPARLVYPRRERDAEESAMFVARVVVDHDGYVVGARLVRGFGGPRDAQAADLIWRFRYEPALDDAGHPIRSTLDQHFLVGR